MGLRLSGLQVYASFGFATAIAVVAVMAAALTLVPALCRFAGRRLLPRRVRTCAGHRRRRPSRAPDSPPAGRPGSAARPLPWAIGAALVMILLALPVLDMRTWPQDPSTQSADLTTRKAFDLVADEFGPGYNGPLTLVVDRDQVGDAGTGASSASSRRAPTSWRSPRPSCRPTARSRSSAPCRRTRRPTSGPPTGGRRPGDGARGVEVTGTTPMFSDIADLLADRLWLVIGFVVGVSILLLAMVFRSVVVPLKAAVMNLLSIGAAYGVVTAVFQWGWGTELLGVDHAVPVSSWMPILMFTILFGLSMDYEVFLLSRIKEDYEATGDPHGSVVRGLAATGKVISCAAAIMVAVFLGFATEVDVLLKMLGVGMASAILLDATVVRMVLVPATMSLLGRWNWWMPASLDRVLPGVRAEITEADLALLAPHANRHRHRRRARARRHPLRGTETHDHPDRPHLAGADPAARPDGGPPGPGRHDDDVPDAPRLPARPRPRSPRPRRPPRWPTGRPGGAGCTAGSCSRPRCTTTTAARTAACGRC